MITILSKIFRRKTLLCLGIVGAVLILLLLPILNGPGFRMIVSRSIASYSAKAGFVAEYELSGSALKGFTISDLQINTPDTAEAFPIKTASLKELDLKYNLIELIRRPNDLDWLSKLQLADADLDISLPQKEDQKSELALILPDYDAAWNALRSEIDLSNVNLKIRKGDAIVLQIDGLNAKTHPGNTDGFLEFTSLKVAKLPEINNVSAPLRVDDNSLATTIALPEWGVALRQLTLENDSTQHRAKLSGQLAAGGGVIDFSTSSDSLLVKLTEGPIHLEDIEPLAIVVPELAATIDQLDVVLLNENLEGQCTLNNFEYHETIKIATTTAKLDGIHFDFDKQVATKGSVRLKSKDLTVLGADIPTFFATANVTTPNLVDIKAEAVKAEQKLLQIDGKLTQDSLSYRANGEIKGQLEDIVKDNASGFAWLKWQGHGQLREALHKGVAQVELTQFEIKGSRKTNGGCDIAYANQNLQLRNLNLSHQNESVKLTGNADFNKEHLQLNSLALTRDSIERLRLHGDIKLADNFSDSLADIHFSSTDLDPNDLAGFFHKELPVQGVINGKLSAKGPFHNLKAKADFVFAPTLQNQSQQQPNVHLLGEFAGNLTTPKTWDINADTKVSGLTYGETLLEDLSAKLTTDKTGSLLAKLSIDQSGATVRGDFSSDLSAADQLDALQKTPIQGELTISIPELQKLRQDFPLKAWRDLPLTGDLNATLNNLTITEGSLTNGTANIGAKSLAIENQTFQKFSIHSNVTAPNQIHTQLAVALDSLATTNGEVSFNLNNNTYQGNIDVDADLAKTGKLRSLLSNRIAAELLPGVTHINWSGQGDLNQKTHQNDVDIDIETLRLAANAEPISIQLNGKLSNNSAEFPNLSITGKDLAITSNVQWINQRLSLKRLTGNFQGESFLTGSAEAPLDLHNFTVASWFTSKQPLDVKLNITKASIAELAKFVIPEIPIQGQINSQLRTIGTPALPQVNWGLDATELTLADPDGKPIDLGILDINLIAKNSVAEISGSFAHPDIKPLQITGQQPFRPADWATKRRDWKHEPLKLRLNLEPSSLAVFMPRFPEIKSLIGSISADATMQGSFAKPTVNGFANLEVSRLKLRDRNAPSIRDVIGLVQFNQTEVLLEKFQAIVAGGTLNASGRADITNPKKPLLDVILKGTDVLVYRNHDVNIRTDVDIKAQGPWQELTLSGQLGINNSYFVKNIDLVPTGLPRFRRSKVPTVGASPRPNTGGSLAVGVPIEPFSNWTSDIRIYTKSPFLIRGNIGHGSATCDLTVTGPLAAPIPTGELLVSEDTQLNLPFSRINVETARVRFNESTAFNGQLELKARGKTDEYDVNIFLHDRLLSPKFVLTSNPQLPTEDIMTLLATGNVRDDLIGSDATQLAASKAASLFLKNLNKRSDAQNQSELINELRDRTEIDFGSFNFNNGVDSVGGRIRLWKQLFFVGNANWDDEYRALLKYIFSFS